MGNNGVETPPSRGVSLFSAIGYAFAFLVGVGLLPAIRPSEDKGSDDR